MTDSASDRERPPFGELVVHFFDEASATLQPWIAAQGGAYTSQLTQASAQGWLETTTPDALQGVFLAEAAFRTGTLVGEISYGDTDLYTNCVVSPLGRPLRHGLWEWADAVGELDIPPRQTMWVLQPERLHAIVRGMTEALIKLATVIAVADVAVIERMTANRVRVSAEQDARWQEFQHAIRVRRANDAFRDKNWPHVVELLSPTHNLLTPSEKAKLQYALARLR